MSRTARPITGRRALALASLVLAFGVLGVLPAVAEAAPPRLSTFCDSGSDAGQCLIPRGLAVDPASGNVYVGDQVNRRIDEFTAWGEFVRAWGWGVVDGSAELQTCDAETGCLQGLSGPGAGQFASAQGVALDSAGDVYVVDRVNKRVQKFDPSGAAVEFELMFGGGVNQGPANPGNLCTAAHIAAGDTCGAGSAGNPGPGEGQFGNWPIVGSFIGVGPSDEIYVGDQTRIQEFDVGGNFERQIEGGALSGETVQSLVVDPAGDLYAIFCRVGKPACDLSFTADTTGPGVHKFDPAGIDPSTDICSTAPISEIGSPTALATDPAGGVYVVDGVKTLFTPVFLRKFDSACEEVQTTDFPFALEDFIRSSGIATSTACGVKGIDLFLSHSDFDKGFVALHGPPPDVGTCPPPEVPPSIEDQYAVSVDTDGATVRAEINPRFWTDTRYYVQYGTAECVDSNWEANCEEQPTPPGALLTDKVVKEGITTAGVFLDGLDPETTYHYRFVAQSSGGGPVFGVGGTEEAAGEEATFTTFPVAPEPNMDCPNQIFRTGPSARLSDCRAYEMVSPLDKNNDNVATRSDFALSSADGARASFSSLRAFGDPQSAPIISQYLAERDPDAGWSTRSISPPREHVSLYPTGGTTSEIQLKAFTEDLCHGWVLQDSNVALAPGAPDGFPNLYHRLNGDALTCESEGYELLTPVSPPGFPGFEYSESLFYPEIQGFSADGERSVFRADAALREGACTTPPKEIFQVYETVGEGELRLVSALPSGKAACTHSSVGTGQGQFGDFRVDSVHGAVSTDASRVYWTTTDSQVSVKEGGGTLNQPGRLYLRANAAEEQSPVAAGKCTDPGKACTYRVSELVTPTAARFLSATPDGSAALFSIVPGSSPDPFANNLYRFSFSEEKGGPVSKVKLIAKNVKGVMGASEDLTRIYLVSTEVLSGAAQNNHGDEAQPGKPNLYLYEADSEQFTFVATLSILDVRNGAAVAEAPSPIATVPFKRTSRVSPDGLVAAFTSAAPLSGNDNRDLVSGEPDTEVFLYDAVAEELLCASCNPSGARPAGRDLGTEVFPLWIAAQITPWEHQQGPSRALSEDGTRLFFETFDALVTRDTNGAKDVYEWERAESRSQCEEEIGGELFVKYTEDSSACLSLISSGQNSQHSEFIDASADGSDVFFFTSANLLAHDPGLIDVYDARVGGGFPPPPAPEPACEGEACQGPLVPPDDPTPASSTFQGEGNQRTSKNQRKSCARGKRKVRRAGRARCVKQKRARRNRTHRSRGGRR